MARKEEDILWEDEEEVQETGGESDEMANVGW